MPTGKLDYLSPQLGLSPHITRGGAGKDNDIFSIRLNQYVFFIRQNKVLNTIHRHTIILILLHLK